MPSLIELVKRLPIPAKRAIKEQIYPPVLPEGDTAPEWQLQAHDNRWHRLRKQWSVLVFHPSLTSPTCINRLMPFNDKYGSFEDLGCEIFAINPAEPEVQRVFAQEHDIRFPLLTDRGAAVTRRFRCTVSIPSKTWIIPTVYLINPERKIRLANRGMPSVEAIIRSIQALQQATRDGM